MRRLITFLLPFALATAAVSGATAAADSTRTIGEAIDDATLVAKVKVALAADRLSNLTKIGVKADRGVVTLSGTLDSVERRARAVELAGAVNGVKAVVNAIDVVPASGTSASAGSSTAPTTGGAGTPQSSIDATGTVVRVDPQAGTITLEDGRIVKTTSGTLIWQPTTIQALRPGTEVLVRDADAVGFGTGQATAASDWRMGTVSRVDAAAGRLVLTDGTIVRVTRTTMVHRGPETLALVRVEPGAEVAVRGVTASSASAEGSASPRPTATGAVIEASEVQVFWTPTSH